MTWPLDPTVYLGLVALFLGHAWLAGGVTDARRSHSLYFGLGLFVLWLALAFVLINMLVDVSYAALDPRARFA